MNKILRYTPSGDKFTSRIGLPSLMRTCILFICLGLGSVIAQGQSLNVSGTINDDTASPLPGASIVEKGTTNGTETDFDGNYNLTVSSSDAVLVISFLGFLNQEVLVNGTVVHNIQLEPNAAALDEVVVTGYGSIKRNEFVGATSVVKAEDLVIAPLVSIEQGMRGQLAGVQVTQSSGQPGAGISIKIRGVSSFAGGTEPLYVIDGVPQFNEDVRGLNGMASLNPNDIESIEVLKDASSTAIYGSRASNGVVQITTKGGNSSEKGKITYNTFISSQKIRQSYDVMNGQEYIDYATEWINNAASLSPSVKSDRLGELASFGNANTDFMGEVLQTGFVQSHNLSFTGGNNKNNYFISTSLLDEKGIIKETDFKRISVRANVKNTLNKSMTLSTRINLAQTKSNGFLASTGTNTRNFGKSGVGSALLATPTSPVYDANGDFAFVLPYSFSGADVENPVAILDALDATRINKVSVMLALTTNFSENISNTTRASADYSERRYDYYTPSALTQIGPQVAILNTGVGLNTLLETFFNYNKSFGKLEVDALVGSSLSDENRETIALRASGFPDDILQNNAFQSASANGIPNTFNSSQSLASFFTRVRLNINKKYLITLNARADGSSVFAESNKWASFGAIGAAWRVSEEDFMENSVFNDLKLRFSTGSTGNQSIRPYQSLTLGQNVLTGQTAGSGVAVGLAPNLANPNLTWETTTQTNFGIDAGLHQNKYRMSLDIYRKITTDLLSNVGLPPSSGFNSIVANNGEIENKGVELQLGADLIDSGDWRLSINGQVSYNKNEVLKTNNGDDVFSNVPGNDTSRGTTIVREGESIFSLYGLKFVGFDETTGQELFEDLNNDGLFNATDSQILASTLPDFTYGFNTSLGFKNWSFDTNWQGVSGNGIMNTTLRDLTLPNPGFNRVKNIRDWYPTSPVSDINSGGGQTDRYIEDGSYLRMANIKLNYDLNIDNIKFIDGLSIYASGQNLITITDYTGFDPEVNSFSGSDARQGIDLGAYPSVKKFTLGLNVSF
jgi:TonB-linked SusC/RagA family outer membrane protein